MNSADNEPNWQSDPALYLLQLRNEATALILPVLAFLAILTWFALLASSSTNASGA